MMLLYGQARRNGRTARQLYVERFTHRQTPSYALIATVFQWALERVDSPLSGPNVGLHGAPALYP